MRLERQPEVLVFDCGDTLVELLPSREVICQEVLQKAGAAVDLVLIRRAYDIADAMMKQRSSAERTREAKSRFLTDYNGVLCDALGLRSLAAAVDPAMQAAFRSGPHWTADPSTQAFLAWASERFPCFVLANWDRRLPAVLDHAGVGRYFTAAYSSESLGIEKPDPECFARFLAASGLAEKRRLYIGNEYLADVVGSRAAGFEPVLIDRHGRYPAAVDCLRITDWGQLRQRLDAAA